MKTTELANYQLATIAVALLGGDTEYIDREDIAVKLEEVAPGRFSWRKYPDRIDLVSVGVALRDAKKPKNGGLLMGSNAKGWMLSSSGLRWVKGFDFAELEAGEMAEHRRDSIFANQEAERIRLRTTTAYKLYAAGEAEEIGVQDFYRFVRVNEYFLDRARRRRYAIVEGAVDDDEALSHLWTFLKEKFREEFA